MAAAGRRKSPSVVDQLFAEPYRFDFFQAVRVLEHAWRARDGQRDGDDGAANIPERQPVGLDALPLREAVRFRAAASLSFPPSSIVNLTANGHATTPNGEPAARGGSAAGGPPEMTVAFLGLTGPAGVLPLHYTRMIMERIREKDYSLRDFFDLFNHRLVSLFYRAWEKYRFPADYQRSHHRLAAHRDGDDLFTSSIYSLAGMGTGGMRGRMRIDDEAFLYYAGYFADQRRPAVSLQRMLAEYFNLQVQVEQFRGQWLAMAEGDRSRMPGWEFPRGVNSCLGVDTVLGSKVWDVQSRFRVRLGPLSYEQFFRFTPAGDGLDPICQMIRTYVGPEFDFDIQPVLLANEVPVCQIGARGGPGAAGAGTQPLLGWNTWLKSRDFTSDFDAAAFELAN